MAVLLISYDVNGNEASKVYEDIRQTIDGTGVAWARPLKSQWLVDSVNGEQWWFNLLSKHFDSGDRLLITRLAPTHSGWLQVEVIEWLKGRLV